MLHDGRTLTSRRATLPQLRPAPYIPCRSNIRRDGAAPGAATTSWWRIDMEYLIIGVPGVSPA